MAHTTAHGTKSIRTHRTWSTVALGAHHKHKHRDHHKVVAKGSDPLLTWSTDFSLVVHSLLAFLPQPRLTDMPLPVPKGTTDVGGGGSNSASLQCRVRL